MWVGWEEICVASAYIYSCVYCVNFFPHSINAKQKNIEIENIGICVSRVDDTVCPL